MVTECRIMAIADGNVGTGRRIMVIGGGFMGTRFRIMAIGGWIHGHSLPAAFVVEPTCGCGFYVSTPAASKSIFV
jgi:hypothetical protein